MRSRSVSPPVMIDLTDEVAGQVDIDSSLASRVLSMFEEGYTVPFIARYRKEVTGGLQPSVLHKLKEKMLEMKALSEKIAKALKTISKKGFMSHDLHRKLRQCRSSEELDLIVKPLKQHGPRTLSDKAKSVGLEAVALDLLKSGKKVDLLAHAPPPALNLLKTKDVIERAVRDIVVEILSKDLDIIRNAENLCDIHPPMLVTMKKKSPIPPKISCTSKIKRVEGQTFRDDRNTFEAYLNFSRPTSQIQAHQILAINRAANRNVLTVKIIIPQSIKLASHQFMVRKYFGSIHSTHQDFMHSAFSDAWRRLIEPHLVRSVRSKLTSRAQDTSLIVFAENLRRLLMTAPLRTLNSLNPDGSLIDAGVISSSTASPGDRLPVLGLDPGWRRGCKWAACDPHGAVLATGVVWPPFISSTCPTGKDSPNDSGLCRLTATMKSHNLQIIALGNGQGSRQTGQWLISLISAGHFHPLRVRFAVVSEAGASWYSASKLADSELPNIDVSLRGAISIARRLQDPLSELVKIEPRHLGIGMYQHDLPEKRLVASVNALMEECISFVGVDLNAAPLHVLSRVAGLTRAKANSIIEYRAKNGYFTSRMDLLKVKGIGQATFAQCAGFVRVRPTFPSFSETEKGVISSEEDCTIGGPDFGSSRKRRQRTAPNFKCKKPRFSSREFNPLDQTAVHPDTYDIASALIAYLKFEPFDIGSSALREAASSLMNSPDRDAQLQPFCTDTFGLDTIRDIVEALSRPLDFDERQDSFIPLFHSSAMNLTELHPGMAVTGRIENVTTFGAFCDIGVQQDAYIPRHLYPSSKHGNSLFSLRLGDRICAVVSDVNADLGRITLTNIKLLS